MASKCHTQTKLNIREEYTTQISSYSVILTDIYSKIILPLLKYFKFHAYLYVK